MADESSVPLTGMDAATSSEKLAEALNTQSKEYYDRIAKQIYKLGDKKMAEILNPSGMMMAGGGSGDGLFGGGGLIGGLILGSLLRNNGNLLGNDGAGLGGAVLRNPPEQNQANMDLMAGIGGISKDVAVAQAAAENSNSMQTNMLSNQLSMVAQATVAQLTGVKEAVNTTAAQINQNIMENRYELSKDISNDGDKTRALITAQYEASLNRQLSDANAAIIALQSKLDNGAVARGVEVTTTNNINQMQQQQQQQAQYGQLANLIWGLGQQIRSTNEAINVGSGTLTANPANTNTNIR